VEAQAVPLRRSRSRRFWMLWTLALCSAVFVAVVVAGLVWLTRFAPLEHGNAWGGLGPHEGVTVQPLSASGGVPVLFPRYRRNGIFHIRTTIANPGRLAVTVLGVPRPGPGDFAIFVPAKVQVSPLNDYGFHLRLLDARHPVRIAPGEERMLTITYRLVGHCVGGQPRRYWTESGGSLSASTDRIPVRFRYARWWVRTQQVQLPFVIELACSRGVVSRRS
jgi:hypothetical protein